MPVLDNPQHESFARRVASGEDKDLAYSRCFPRAGKRTANVNGCKLAKTVSARIRELQELSATKTTLTMQERRQFVADLVRTPIAEIDEHSPLCQSVKYIESQHGSSREFRVPDKLAAVMADAKLAGELIEKVEQTVDDKRTITADERARRLEAILARRREQN